jgi:hypothetical protein
VSIIKARTPILISSLKNLNAPLSLLVSLLKRPTIIASLLFNLKDPITLVPPLFNLEKPSLNIALTLPLLNHYILLLISISNNSQGFNSKSINIKTLLSL